MSTADPSDVQGVIETELDDPDIQAKLDDAEFDAQQAIDDYATALTSAERTQLEKYLAALKIVLSTDRAVTEDSVGDSTLVYDGSTVSWLRGEVNRRDPSGSLATSVVRDTDRHVSSTS